MAYITGEYTYKENEDIKIIVLQPTKDEYSFKEGLKTMMDFDSMDEFTPKELADLGKWVTETALSIRKNYNKNGSKKKHPSLVNND